MRRILSPNQTTVKSFLATMRIHLAHEMSPEAKALQPNKLAAKVAIRMGERSVSARQRIRDEMDRQKLSQRDVADLLSWSQSRVGKLLTGRVELGVDDLNSLAFAVGLTLTEVVRDRGMEFCAELTPTELRFLQMWKKSSQADRDAVVQLLTGRPKLDTEERRASRKKPPRKSS